MIKLINILHEAKVIATVYQFTPEQYDLLKRYGVKKLNNETLLFPALLIDELNKRQPDSTFKQEFEATTSIENRYNAQGLLTALKKALDKVKYSVVKTKEGEKTYKELKGHTTKNNNFNFPNPYREDIKTEKLDPVGQEDKDVNNDGKVNSQDKYLFKRRTAIAKNLKEGDHEVSMANTSLDTIIKAATELKMKLGNMERNIPGWIQDHITNAENYIEQASKGFHELKDDE